MCECARLSGGSAGTMKAAKEFYKSAKAGIIGSTDVEIMVRLPPLCAPPLASLPLSGLAPHCNRASASLLDRRPVSRRR